MNRKNLMLMVIGVFVVLLLIFFLTPSSPESGLVQKQEEFFSVENSVAYLDVFMLKSIILDDHYFYDEAHPPYLSVQIWIPDQEAWIIWHVVNITKSKIQELIDSGEGFTKYVVENGSNGNGISEEVIITEPGEYIVVFRQTNIQVGTQPYDLRIYVVYWGSE
jgi:hypothetical protein